MKTKKKKLTNKMKMVSKTKLKLIQDPLYLVKQTINLMNLNLSTIFRTKVSGPLP